MMVQSFTSRGSRGSGLGPGETGVSTVAAALVLVIGLMVGAAVVYAAAPDLNLTTTKTVAYSTTVTTTPAVPLTFSISGKFTVNTPLTTGTGITFVAQDGTSYSGVTSGTSYSVSGLPNQGIYTVKITFTPSTGNSPCTAGVLVVYLQFTTSLTHDWSC